MDDDNQSIGSLSLTTLQSIAEFDLESVLLGSTVSFATQDNNNNNNDESVASAAGSNRPNPGAARAGSVGSLNTNGSHALPARIIGAGNGINNGNGNGGPRAKHWCFTINNYTDAIVSKLERLDCNDGIVYLIAGREVGDTGTPHLQGFISFTSRVRRSTVTRTIGQAHCTCARLVKRALEYCKKDGDYFEIGDESKVFITQGKRGDLDAFKEAVKSHQVKNPVQIREQFSEVYAKYRGFCLEYLEDSKPKPEFGVFPLRIWQANLFVDLQGVPSNREIIFVVDILGNGGKTWFAHYVANLLEDGKVQVLLPGKKADMNYALDTGIRILFIDAPRSKQGDFIQYDFLEEVKNGYIASYKYESRCKRLGPCHVVVFMNEYPDMTKLSQDRYRIIEVTDANLACATTTV